MPRRANRDQTPHRCFRCREPLNASAFAIRFLDSKPRPPGRRERGRPVEPGEGEVLICTGCATDFKAWLRGPKLGIFAGTSLTQGTQLT